MLLSARHVPKKRTPPERRRCGTACRRVLLGGCHRRDGDEAAALTLVDELDDAVDLGEERVVAADADVHARVELRAALADENRATGHELAGEALDAEHF